MSELTLVGRLHKWIGGNPVSDAGVLMIQSLARIEALEAAVEKSKADMLAHDDFQCRIASALGWDTHGKPMDECVRELVAFAAAQAATKEVGT